MARTATSSRNDALDGLRLVAVTAVMAFHFGIPYASAGFLGVDVFFVLSGYLITWLLLSQLQGGQVKVFDFWARRMRRLIPALLVVIGAVLVWGAVVAPSFSRDSLRGDITATLFYVANWHFISTSTYFASDGVASPLQHMWSLAVEEQFYLIWPSIVRHLSAVRVLRLGLVLIVLAAGARVVLGLRGVSTNTLYVLMPTRADLLAWGAVLAALIRLPNGLSVIRRLLWPALIAAALWIISVMLHFGSSYYWSRGMVMAGYPAVALGAVCLVAIALLYEPAPLRFSWLTQIGKVSYGLYLWHMTGIAVLTPLTRSVGAGLIPLALLVSLVPTLLSWYVIERPLLSLKRYAPMRATEQPIARDPAATLGKDLSLSTESEN
jgi:peptidoglycan/LPS O-acetylase OafA/YrhL